MGGFNSCWGHEITDNLKYLWFYFDERFDYLKKLKFIFVSVSQDVAASNNFWTMLKLIGIPKNKFHVLNEPTRFSRIFIPDACFFHDSCTHYTLEYLNLFKRLPRLSPISNLNNIEKVYFSRTAFPSRKDFNEKEIENCFKKQGFSIIYPEKNTFVENLAILQHCKIFAGTDGSIVHNLIFCKEGTTAIICRKSRHFTKHQMPINEFKKAKVIYIDTAFTPFFQFPKEWWAGPFFLYETNYLRRYFGLLPRKYFPFWEFSKYVLYYLDLKLFFWTHPIRAKLKIGTRLRRLLNKR